MKTMSIRHTKALDLNKIDLGIKNSNLKDKSNNNDDDKTPEMKELSRKSLVKTKKKVQIVVDLNLNF